VINDQIHGLLVRLETNGLRVNLLLAGFTSFKVGEYVGCGDKGRAFALMRALLFSECHDVPRHKHIEVRPKLEGVVYVKTSKVLEMELVEGKSAPRNCALTRRLPLVRIYD
jgi:hypothetical protein